MQITSQMLKTGVLRAAALLLYVTRRVPSSITVAWQASRCSCCFWTYRKRLISLSGNSQLELNKARVALQRMLLTPLPSLALTKRRRASWHQRYNNMDHIWKCVGRTPKLPN